MVAAPPPEPQGFPHPLFESGVRVETGLFAHVSRFAPRKDLQYVTLSVLVRSNAHVPSARETPLARTGHSTTSARKRRRDLSPRRWRTRHLGRRNRKTEGGRRIYAHFAAGAAAFISTHLVAVLVDMVLPMPPSSVFCWTLR